MSESPIEQLLMAIDRLDLEAVMSLAAPYVRLLTVDGRRASEAEGARRLLGDFLSALRSTTHVITAQWHQDDVWIAEVEASYELRDWLKINGLPRVFIVRMGPDGIADLRVYGAHERPLEDHRRGDEGLWIGDRWVPPL